MKLAVASDHAGFELKQGVLRYLQGSGHELEDFGTHNRVPVDYPDVAERLAMAVRSGAAGRGILICGSGVGASVAANKVPGVRAAVCHDTYSAHQGVEHDNMNVLVLGARVIALSFAEELVASFLNAEFFAHEERYVRRLEKVQNLERRFCGVERIEERLAQRLRAKVR